jgi:hypothetical protein
MEDDPMPNKYKRVFFRKLEKMLWDNMDENDTSYINFASEICKF